MDQQLLEAVIARADVSEEQAEEAIRAMVEFMEESLPVGIAAHVSRVADVDLANKADDLKTTQNFAAVTGAFTPDE